MEKIRIRNYKYFCGRKITGEISAGAGIGTSGGTIAVGIKENNYLGKGLSLDANATLSSSFRENLA